MIEVGDQLPNLTLIPRDADGVRVEPDSVTLAITLPDNTVSTPNVTKSGAGETLQYSARYIAVQSGIHVVEWNVTGAYAGTFRDTAYVEQNTSIVSLRDVKDFLGVTRQGHDEVLRLLMLMASDACESPEGTNRRWRRRIVTNERHTAGPVFQLYNAPIVSITEVSADGTTFGADDYDVDLNTGMVYPIASGLSYGTRRFGTSWSYVAGGATCPPIVRNGVLEMVRHLYMNHRGGSGLPSQAEPDYTTSLAYLVPNRVESAWRAYRMPG